MDAIKGNSLKEKIGIQYEPYSLKIEEGKIKEFAAAIGDDNPIYYSEVEAKKQGYKGIPIPLTFLQVVDLWGGPDFQEKVQILQLNPVKVLHGEQEYEFIDDIYAGDILSVTATVIDVVVKEGSSGGMDLITTENKYINQNGELVAISRQVTIQRH